MSVQRDVDAELRFHFDARIEELIEQGMTRDGARAQAVAEFGDVEATRASLRAIDSRVAKRRNRAELIDALVQDVRYSLRSLRRTPAVSLTIILTLALGIGVNAAMFSLLDAIYLRPPAGVANPDEIRRVWTERKYRSGAAFGAGFDHAAYLSLARFMEGQADVAFYSGAEPRKLALGYNAPLVNAGSASPNFFDVLGVRPALGRTFTADENAPGQFAPVAIISDEFWKRTYGNDSDPLGKSLSLGTTKFTIIGVLPPGFRGIDLDVTDVWVPTSPFVGLDRQRAVGNWWQSPNINGFQVVYRAKPPAREAELVQRATQALRQPGIGWKQDTLAVAAVGSINHARGPGKISDEMQVSVRLAAVAILVLLIACANVVNLLLARAVSRRREISVRLALGISKSRLVRLLVTESVVLALFATLAALVTASWGTTLLRSLLMPGIQWSTSILHWRVLLFATGIAVVAGLVAGLVPAFRSASPDLTSGLKAGSRNAGVHHVRLRSILVIVQAAFSVVLLVGAVLFVQSLRNVKARDVGYSIDRLVFATVNYDTKDSARDAQHATRLRHLEERLANIPGVERVAFTSSRPKWSMSFPDFFPDADTIAHRKPDAVYTAVSPGFFAASGTKLIRGSTFKDERGVRGAPSVIINQALADALWPRQDPIGRCIRFDKPTAPCATIIGVVQTAIVTRLDEKPFGQMYISLDNPAARTWGAHEAVLRVDPSRRAQVQTALRPILRAQFPGGIPSINTMAKAMESDYRPWELGARLFTLFGVLALIVAGIGVYSTVAYAVNQRTHEFGVRIALGARAADVLLQVLSQGLKTVVVGILAGILLAIGAGKFIASLLYGIAPRDPLSMFMVAATLIAIGALAALVPAWRASRSDPLVALRAD